MKIVLTGGSGFLGSVIQERLGAAHEINSVGRDHSNTVICDLKSTVPTLDQADIVVHAAGKAHVIPKTEAEKEEFFQVNVEGTQNLLAGVKRLPALFVFISTVAVYGMEEGLEIREDHPLMGQTPYAKSKIAAEELVTKWGKEHRVNVVILRLPLVAGPNPPGNLGAMIQSMKRGYYFRLGSGQARKSIVLANDIADLIPRLVGKSGIFNVTDGTHPSLAQLDQKIAEKFGKKVKSFPAAALRALAKVGDMVSFFPLNSYRINKLTQTLTFSDELARRELDWKPKSVLDNLFQD